MRREGLAPLLIEEEWQAMGRTGLLVRAGAAELRLVAGVLATTMNSKGPVYEVQIGLACLNCGEGSVPVTDEAGHLGITCMACPPTWAREGRWLAPAGSELITFVEAEGLHTQRHQAVATAEAWLAWAGVDVLAATLYAEDLIGALAG